MNGHRIEQKTERKKRGEGTHKSVCAFFGFLAMTMSLLTSCLTSSDPIVFDSAPLFGMIYDADNRPVSGARVTVGEEQTFESGVMGRVVIPDLPRGTHVIAVAKRGYEPVALTVEFFSRSHVLYVRMVSFESLLSQAESAMSRGRFDEATDYLDRAAAVSPGDPRAAYARALLAYLRRNGAVAGSILERMIDEGYGRAFVHVLLADVHQYLLKDDYAAAASLRRYLKARDDAAAEERLSRLLDLEPGTSAEPADESAGHNTTGGG